MIEVLTNSVTKTFVDLQKQIHHPHMHWQYHDPMSFPGKGREEELPFYSHQVMGRPMQGQRYSMITSCLFDITYRAIEEILTQNKIELNTIYRINFNATFNNGELKQSSWHKDLNFPHKNLIVYMNSFEGSGATMVRQDDNTQDFEPQLNDAIVFDGSLEHCHLVPTSGRRITLVVNYL